MSPCWEAHSGLINTLTDLIHSCSSTVVRLTDDSICLPVIMHRQTMTLCPSKSSQIDVRSVSCINVIRLMFFATGTSFSHFFFGIQEYVFAIVRFTQTGLVPISVRKVSILKSSFAGK